MYIDNLVLELTRQCNLKCQHCLRGGAQRLKMSREVMYNTLSHVSHIGCLTLTGGEPSLATDVMEELISFLKWHKVTLSYFYIVTNGKTRNGWKKFLGLCGELYEWADEKGSCSLSCSQDKYHREMHDINLNKFREEWGYYLPYFQPEGHKEVYNVLREGRSASGLGWKDPVQQKPWVIEDESELCIYEGMVYVAANGNVTSECDMSFSRIDKESKGNVLKAPLPEIIRGYSVMRVDEVSATA